MSVPDSHSRRIIRRVYHPQGALLPWVVGCQMIGNFILYFYADFIPSSLIHHHFTDQPTFALSIIIYNPVVSLPPSIHLIHFPPFRRVSSPFCRAYFARGASNWNWSLTLSLGPFLCCATADDSSRGSSTGPVYGCSPSPTACCPNSPSPFPHYGLVVLPAPCDPSPDHEALAPCLSSRHASTGLGRWVSPRTRMKREGTAVAAAAAVVPVLPAYREASLRPFLLPFLVQAPSAAPSESVV